MKKTLLCSALLAALMSVSGGAQAALVSQGTGLVYDNVNNLLWYSDLTNRNWDGATSWASTLTTNGLSWSLATRNQFSTLAAAAGSTNIERNTTLLGLGIPGGYMWSSELQSPAQYVSDPFGGGYQQDASYYMLRNDSYLVGAEGWSSGNSADGSLAVASYTASAPSAVPIPAAAWLMASGLGALGVAARKRRAKAA
jgi:hypothetical protein